MDSILFLKKRGKGTLTVFSFVTVNVTLAAPVINGTKILSFNLDK